MKTGLAISVFVLAVAVGLRLLQLREPVDQPTVATASHTLQRFDLPEGLAVLFEQGPETGNNHGGLDELTDACEAASGYLTGGDSPQRDEQAAQVCTALIASLSGGEFRDGFVDRMIAPDAMFTESAQQLFRVVAMSADRCFTDHLAAERFVEADAIARAQFELGRRVFVQNTRVRVRQHGLGLMQAGLQQAGQAAQATHDAELLDAAQLAGAIDAIQAWEDAIARIAQAWSAKLRVIESARPNVADLVRVAEEDADRSFRVFATHQLGYARFERGEPGNQRLLAQTIQRARGSADPLIAAAGESAAGLTREQFQTPRP